MKGLFIILTFVSITNVLHWCHQL